MFAVLGVGLVIRVAALFLYLSTHDWKGETWEPEEIAINLLEGRGFTLVVYGDIVYRALFDPVYPALCYVLHRLGGPGLGLYYVFQLLTALGIIGLTYTIADRWFGSQIAMVAALLVALEPGLIIYHSYKVDDLALGTLLFLGGLHVFTLMTQNRSGLLAILTGPILGVGVLTRPDLLGMFILLPAWALLEWKRVRIVVKPLGLIIVTAVLVCAPWAIRNYLVLGQFVFPTTYSGEALWRGNNPNSSGTTVTLALQSQFDAAPAEFQKKISVASEVEKNRLFKEEAWHFIANDPTGFLLRSLKKFFYFWWFTPTYAAQHYDWLPRELAQGYQWLWGGLLICAILGVWSVVCDGIASVRAVTYLLLLAPISVATLHSVSYVEGRHRMLVMPALLILTAIGIRVFPRLLRGAATNSQCFGRRSSGRNQHDS